MGRLQHHAQGKTRRAAFEEWRTATGYDAQSRYEEASPKGIHVTVLPNHHEKGRAHIVVLNWDRAGSVRVDLGGVLAPGQPFRIVNAQKVFDAPVLAGEYREPVELPMRPVTAEQPVGMPDAKLLATGPEFGVFVVLPGMEP